MVIVIWLVSERKTDVIYAYWTRHATLMNSELKTSVSVKVAESFEQLNLWSSASRDQLLHREVTACVSYWASWIQISSYPEDFSLYSLPSGKCRTVNWTAQEPNPPR